MKKISVVFAMMFVAGFTMAFGQMSKNYVSIIQNGNTNTADVLSQKTQDGSNALYFWQNGDGNSITAQQKSIYDALPGSISTNYSEGEQNGNYNYAKVSQDSYSNTSYLKQNGTGNKMYLDQEKSSPIAALITNFSQNVQGSGSSYNEFTLDQQGNLNTSKLWEDGNLGKAWVTQHASFPADQVANNSNVYQDGNTNQLVLSQTIIPNGYTPNHYVNSSVLQQNGNSNYASIFQVGEYVVNNSDILQHGDDNNSYLIQGSQISNTSTNLVEGDRNYLKIGQSVNSGVNVVFP